MEKTITKDTPQPAAEAPEAERFTQLDPTTNKTFLIRDAPMEQLQRLAAIASQEHQRIVEATANLPAMREMVATRLAVLNYEIDRRKRTEQKVVVPSADEIRAAQVALNQSKG